MRCLSLILVASLMLSTASVDAQEKNSLTPQKKTDEERVQVLVLKYDMPKGYVVTEDDVMVRDLHRSETDFYDQNRGSFLPPHTAAIRSRVTIDRMRADVPLRRKDFSDEGLATTALGLGPKMRTVIVTVPDLETAMQLGNCVDVWLTAEFHEDGAKVIRTAMIARPCRVLERVRSSSGGMKGKAVPVRLTLEANPYRAALIDYASNCGKLTLRAVSGEEVPVPMEVRNPTFSDMRSKEYRDEDVRVDGILKGELSIGPADLERIFHIVRKPPTAKEVPPPVGPQPTKSAPDFSLPKKVLPSPKVSE